MALFEHAARRNGPFRLPARLQQADVQNRLGQGRDALTLYDGVLTATDRPDARATRTWKRVARRCAAGARRCSPWRARRAAGRRLPRGCGGVRPAGAGTPGASLLWRRQALTLKGQALEKLGDADAALAAYDDALNAPNRPPLREPATPPPEWTWFYRAGSDAARLLEARAQWEAAIAIYEKLAAADGPMKSEFENQLKREQLEHFIWEE